MKSHARFAKYAGGLTLLIVLTVLLITGGTSQTVRAQSGQICRDVGNLTVCGDRVDVENSQGEFRLADNIRIGTRGGPMLLAIDNRQISFNGQTGTIHAEFDHANQVGQLGASNFVVGSIRWLNDPTGQPLLQSHLIADPRDSNNILVGIIHVDVNTGRIFIPAAGAIPRDVAAGIVRNSNMLFPYMDRAALRAFYKEGGTVGEFATIDGVFDVPAKVFTATMPINLKLNDNDENPDLRVTLRASFNQFGQFNGSVDGFKLKLGALLAEAKGVVLRIGEFEAATVDISKSDNPDLPTLDPTNPQLIFQFQKLKYKDGKFSIGGGAVGVADWVFGDNFKLTNQTLGISTDSATRTVSFTINSKLVFGNVLQSATQVPIVVRIGAATVNGVRKPIIQATLTTLTTNIGPLKLNLKNVSLLGDPVQNFFGLHAQTVDLQWPANLGGKTAAGLSGLKLGINRDKNLIFELAGGTIGTPEFDSGVLKGSLAGTISVLSNVVTFNLHGTMLVKLQGNGGVAPTVDMFLRGGPGVADTCPPNPGSCQKRFEMKLSGFQLQLAGFTVGLTNPRGLGDGGFAADQATLQLPPGLGNIGGQINGLTVSGNGDVTMAGGGIEIPPIQLGGFQFVGLKGTFFKNTTGGYEFTAGGTMPLPGLEPGGSTRGIAATVTIRTKPDGGLQGLGVEVIFSARPGIVIGSTGMELTSIGGAFDVNAGTVQIGVSMRAETSLRLIGLALASVDGNATLKINPFKFTANAKLSVLIFSVAQASLQLGDGAGFSGGKGMNVNFTVNAVIVHGNASLRLGKVTVNGQQKFRFAASASYEVGLDKGQFGFLLPPFNIHLFGVSFQGGQFEDRRDDPPRTTAGMLGTISVGPFDGSLFVDLSKRPNQSGFVSLVNANKFSLINSLVVRRLAAQGEPGYSSRTLSATEARALGLSAADGGTLMQDAVPIVVTQTTTLVAGIHYTDTVVPTPTIRLQLPGGSTLTEQNVNGTTQFFVRDDNQGHDLAFIIHGAAPGTYSLSIDGAPSVYEKVSYQLNESPKVTITSATCGVVPLPGVSVTCNSAPAGISSSISWMVSDIDSPEAKVTVGYVAVPTDSTPIDLANMQILTTGLSLGSGSFGWLMNQTPTGEYRLVVRVEDGSNAPVDAIAALNINIQDQLPPAVPSGVIGSPLPGELLVNWTQNVERDLAGYEIGFGIVQSSVPDNAANFVYSRNMGPKELVVTTTNVVDAKLWGLKDDEEIFFGLRAYDLSGNYSAWSPLVRAKPWPLAPDAWTPTPNGTGPSAKIEVAFATPLNSSTLNNALELRDASNRLIVGQLSYITNLDGDKVLGLSFTPGSLLANGVYTATVKGGAAGVTAADGRQMPQDYRWRFTIANPKVYMPLIRR